jgi:DNA topoisomerase-2
MYIYTYIYVYRVYDIAATVKASGCKLSVFLNGKRIESRSFEQYISICSGLSDPCAFAKINDNWEVGVAVSEGSFQQV